jgi:hypothetical protein
MKLKINLGLMAVLASCTTASGPGAPLADELIVCGGDEVMGVEAPASGPPRKLWGWRAKEAPELPELVRKQFESTDECKPVSGGRLLVTSSGGGVALVDRGSGQATFWASVVNAHSAELLSGDRIVVASSYGEGGNRLVLFDATTPGKLLAGEELYGAHGVVWDGEAKLLWALGEIELRAYAFHDLETSTPSFVQKRAYTLPNPGGHDLRAVPKSTSLVVTSGHHVWLFDRRLLNFAPCGGLSDLRGVKSVDVHPVTGRLAYVQAEKQWWAEHIRFRNPEGEALFPGQRLYKARWALTSD